MKSLILLLIFGIAYINAADSPSSAFSYLKVIKLKKSNLLTKLKVVGKEYSVSFEVKITRLLRNKWAVGNVIHFTVGSNIGKAGSRIPGVWFVGSKKQFQICTPCFFTKGGYKIGVWIPIKILQFRSMSGYRFRVYINNIKVKDVKIKNPKEYKNVKVYAGDPWYSAQPGFIRNLIVGDPCQTANGGCKQICTHKKGKAVCSCKSGYTLAGDGKKCNTETTKECIKKKCGSTAMGCFTQYAAPMKDMKMLFNARLSIKWDKKGFKDYVCNVVCKCAKAAVDQKYLFFSIRFYGECMAGKNLRALITASLAGNTMVKQCVKGDGTYRRCNGSGGCIGMGHADYVYALRQ